MSIIKNSSRLITPPSPVLSYESKHNIPSYPGCILGLGWGLENKKFSYGNVTKVMRNNGKIKKKLKKNFQGVKWVIEKTRL